MDLQIVNEEALEIIKLGEMSQEEVRQYYEKNRNNDSASLKAIIGAYSGELITAAEDADVKLDLTYDTVSNISPALIMLYNKQYRGGYEDQRNKIVTCRTLAAYIVLLIINLFTDCHFDVKRYANRKNESRPELWADTMMLKLDHKKNSDILPFVWQGADRAPIEMEDGFILDITPLVEGYKRLTGDDLVEKGLCNIILTHE